MPEFQSVRSSPLGPGLFSAGEVEGLMRVEFARAQRHRYPVVCMMIAVDRLAQLQDLYGWESKDEILRAVVGLLRASTRESDLIGALPDDRLVALYPHTSPEVAAMLARRVLLGARRMRFDRDGKRLSVSLSIGVAHNQHEGSLSFDTLVHVAEDGLAVADAAGGDRFVETELYELHERRRAGAGSRARGTAPAPAAPLPGGTGGGSAEGAGDETGEEPGEESDPLRSLDPQALERVLQILAEERETRPGEDLTAARQRIDVLERRIAKLTHLLGLTEDELKRVAAMKGVDLGVASIYRSVQGLAFDATQRERKRAMMREIFKANLELFKHLTGDEGAAGV